jgi:hypothetical protein
MKASLLAIVLLIGAALAFATPAFAQTPPATPAAERTSVPGHLLQVVFGPRPAGTTSFAFPETDGLPHFDGAAAVRNQLGSLAPTSLAGYTTTYAGADGSPARFQLQVLFANPDGVRVVRLNGWTKTGPFLMSVPANSPVTAVEQTRIGGLDALTLLPTAAVAGGIGPRTIFLTDGASVWRLELDGFTSNDDALALAALVAASVTAPAPPGTGNSGPDAPAPMLELVAAASAAGIIAALYARRRMHDGG